MKTNSRKLKIRIWLGITMGLALLLLAASTQSVVAQSNTFPSTGNAGVGTTSPQAKLDVQGSSSYGVSGIFSAIYAKGTADYPMALILDGAGTNDGVARMRALNNGATKWQVNYADDVNFYSWMNNT